MNLAKMRQAVRDFLIEYDHEPASNVVYLNTPFARANARQAAQLLEHDRAAVREDIATNLMRERRRLQDRIMEIDTALMELHGG